MKQVVQNMRGEVRVVDVPPPVLRPGGVLVRTVASLVSPGTERANVERSRQSLMARARQRPDLVRLVLERLRREGLTATMRSVTDKLESLVPMGYSAAGIVEAVGEGAEEFQVGDLVACAGGGHAVHAEFIWVPKNLCARAPITGISADAAAFATLGAIALHGIRQAEIQLGETVAVIGLGLLGLLTTQLLEAAGTTVLASDPDAGRAKLAQSLGARETAAPGPAFLDLVQRATAGRGADAVIITAATESRGPIVDAGHLARDRARVVIVGDVPADVPRSPYYEKEVDVRFSRSYGPGRYDPSYEELGTDYPIGYVRWTEGRNLEAFLALVAQGKVRTDPLLTHRYPIEKAEEAYAVITSQATPSLAVLIDYPGRVAPATRVELPPARRSRTTAGKLGVSLIGAGSFAQSVLLPAFRETGQVTFRGVASGGGLTARSVGERWGFRFAGSGEQDVLADSETEAVIIATRHHLHAPQVLAALQAGKHVFVEKPLCLRAEEVEQIETAHREAEERFGARVLLIGFNRRFAPQIVRIRELLAHRQGPIHLRYRINAGAVPAGSWVHDPAIGGGRWIGEGCHFVDLAAAVIGHPPTRVQAEASKPDALSALLRFADGSVATVEYLSTGHAAVPKEQLEIVGEGSVILLDDYRTLRWDTPGGSGRDARRGQDKGHRAETAAFVAGARAGVAPIPIAEQMMSMRATFAVADALATGMPITLG